MFIQVSTVGKIAAGSAIAIVAYYPIKNMIGESNKKRINNLEYRVNILEKQMSKL